MHAHLSLLFLSVDSFSYAESLSLSPEAPESVRDFSSSYLSLQEETSSSPPVANFISLEVSRSVGCLHYHFSKDSRRSRPVGVHKVMHLQQLGFLWSFFISYTWPTTTQTVHRVSQSQEPRSSFLSLFRAQASWISRFKSVGMHLQCVRVKQVLWQSIGRFWISTLFLLKFHTWDIIPAFTCTDDMVTWANL